ncbi:MAG: hypothetical protein ACT4TC_13385 [Myxococcaceae bacterium]
MPSPFVLEKASVLCYRIYDIADEISLEKARSLLSADAQRLKLNRENSQYLLLPNPPLTVELRDQPLPLREGAVTVKAVARIFDHGAVSIIVRVPVQPNTSFDQLIAIADELYDSAAVDQLTLSLIEGVRKSVEAAVEDPHLWEQSESYTVTFVEKIVGNPSANELFHGADLARLLLGETGGAELSERERGEVTQHRFSYRENDLAVVDWNSAFVYEPSGSSDIPDVLEICNAQLLELRYYDDVLDKNVLAIYDEVQRKRRSWHSIVRSPYKLLARRVLALVLEMSEFIERVENSLKIIGDFYLAKVYEASVKRLRIRAWQASVTRKQQMLANVYQLLKGELDTDRSLLLETTIVLLIIGEIVIAFGPLLRH